MQRPMTPNYIRKHYDECDPTGLWTDGSCTEGTGVLTLHSNIRWNATGELADAHLSRVSYAWRSGPGGVDIQQNREYSSTSSRTLTW